MRSRTACWATATAFGMGLSAVTFAMAEPPRFVPPPAGAHVQMRPLPRAEVSAMMLGALSRYASGARASTPVERALFARLSRIPGSRATVQSLMQRVERTPIAHRSALLPGVSDARAGSPIDHSRFRANIASTGPTFIYTSHLPDQQPSGPPILELDYAGLYCVTPPTSTPHVAVYAAKLVSAPNNTYTMQSHMFPSSGSIASPNAGTASTQGAGKAFDTNGPFVLVTALVPDDGDLATHQSDIGVLIATAETFAAMAAGTDRLTPLATSIQASLNLLVLSNPSKWTAGSVNAQVLDGGYATKPTQTTAGIAWKLGVTSDTAGSNMQILFNGFDNSPKATATVTVSVKEVRLVSGISGASGTVPNTQAPVPLTLSAFVSIQAASESYGPGATCNLGKTVDARPSGCNVDRKLIPGGSATIGLHVEGTLPGPSFMDTSTCPGSTLNCTPSNSFCGDNPQDPNAQPNSYYQGPCPPQRVRVRLDPNGGNDLSIGYALATGALSGASGVSGVRGTPITVTGAVGQGGGFSFGGSGGSSPYSGDICAAITFVVN